jgi:hypothetical protein
MSSYLMGRGQKEREMDRYESNKLQCWFNLSYASFLTLPRVLMEAMSLNWQDKMADLLNEYDEMFPNQPNIGTRVQIVQHGKLIKGPSWITNYRHPEIEEIEKLKKK